MAKEVRFPIRMDEDFSKEITIASVKEGMSKNSFIIKVIKDYLIKEGHIDGNK